MAKSKMSTTYDVEKRGAAEPTYTDYEEKYRNRILTRLNNSYDLREQNHMEFNDRTYSDYYLTNHQQDMAYNPPKVNPGDSRLVTGTTHEKVNTVQQLIMDMNFMPRVRAYDKDDATKQDLASFMTSKVKNSLKKEGFKKKLGNYTRINVAQGNVFIMEQRTKKFETRKIPVGRSTDAFKQQFNIMTEQVDEICESIAVANTSVFLPNLLQEDICLQPYIHVVLHQPTVEVAQKFAGFPRWKNVPKSQSMTVSENSHGTFGDFFLKQPNDDYCEVIIYQDMPHNEYQVMINGVMMYPVTESKGEPVGFPLTYFSPSGKYNIIKGDNERIPFFTYGKGIPTKNEVKEETANEFLRIATHKFRYSAFPSVGNNSDKILPANIWDPSVVVPDLQEGDISVLNPKGGLTSSDFSFYQMIMNSIDETSVSKSLEGANNSDITATQYVDQKKESLKKLGTTIDGTIEFLRDFFWIRLFNEVFYLDKKKKQYSVDKQKFEEMYENLIGVESIDGGSRAVNFNLVEEIPEMDPYKMFMDEKKNPSKPRTIYLEPKKVRELIMKIKDSFYMDVVSEPDGKEQALLGILMNTLMAYQDIRGGTIPNLNYEQLDKVIDQNSGFEENKLFTKVPTSQMGDMYGATGQMESQQALQQPSRPKQPQNSLLANAK